MSKYAKEEHYLDPAKLGEGHENVNPEDHLLPCPFCGGTEVSRCWDDNLYWIRCTSCGATGPDATKYSGVESDPCFDPDNDWNSRTNQRQLIYWLLRAYQSGHREGWEQGPSTDDTMDGICDVLANLGFDPSLSQGAKDLLSNGADK